MIHGHAEQPLLGPEADEASRPGGSHRLPVLRRVRPVVDGLLRDKCDVSEVSGRRKEGRRVVVPEVT